MVILKCGCLNIDVVGRHVLLVIRFVLLLNKKFAVVAARQNQSATYSMTISVLKMAKFQYIIFILLFCL